MRGAKILGLLLSGLSLVGDIVLTVLFDLIIRKVKTTLLFCDITIINDPDH